MKGQKVFDGLVKNIKFLGQDGEILTAGKSGKIPPGQINGTGSSQANAAEPNQYYYHPDHLGSTSYVTDASGEVYQHLEYFAFGETFVEEHSNTDRTPYLFNGKELDEETGLYYYGARYYDARISVWLSVDPLADIAPDRSPYHFVSNNPINRVDPTGLTDFKINKETGDVTQVGKANDDPDRVLKTNRKGEIKYKKNGDARVAFGGVEKGILSDGMNFKKNSYAFEVGGEGHPSEQGVESFALKLSDYVGKEISGAYFSLGGASETTHMTIGNYKNNKNRESRSSGLGSMKPFINSSEEFLNGLRGKFHTHPNGAGLSDSDRLAPSPADIETRDKQLKVNPSLRFFLLTHPEYGDKFPKKIEYTKGFQHRKL
ncbi:MAG: hypothetical protein OEW87_14220 [Flavobacteriaceae bacterium]|nr:hypothetical protein [Flavobacteriaceae bacterium]